MIRVLHSVSNMDRGGIETMLMNYYRHIDREKVQFDFIVNKQKPGDYDDEIRRLGGHIYQSPGLNPLHYGPSRFRVLRHLCQYKSNGRYHANAPQCGASDRRRRSWRPHKRRPA